MKNNNGIIYFLVTGAILVAGVWCALQVFWILF
jgi:hypothetical protein